MSNANMPAEKLEPGRIHEPSGRRVGGVETIAGGDRRRPAEAAAGQAAEKAPPARKK